MKSAIKPLALFCVLAGLALSLSALISDLFEESTTFSIKEEFAPYPEMLPAGMALLTNGVKFKWSGKLWAGYYTKHDIWVDDDSIEFDTCREAVEDAWSRRELFARDRENRARHPEWYSPKTDRPFVLADPEVCNAVVAREEPDQEDVFAEVSTRDISGASERMMWALRSDARYKWVELRAKPGDPDTLLVVRHTRPKPAISEPSTSDVTLSAITRYRTQTGNPAATFTENDLIIADTQSPGDTLRTRGKLYVWDGARAEWVESAKESAEPITKEAKQ